MKNIYLAGKLNSTELNINDFSTELENRGHKILEKWWLMSKLPTPYLENLEISSVAAKVMINASFNSDITILFPEDRILGAAVELGAAIAGTILMPEKKVIIVNPYDVRQSVFYAHPSVIALRNIEDIRAQEWY